MLDEKDAVIDDDIYIVDSEKAYIREVRRIPKLSEDKREELISKLKTDKEARERFCKDNLRLVISIAKRNVNKTKSLTLLDLIQEGNIGLIKAVNKYDSTKGYKFSTYATWWIDRYIKISIAHDRMISFPEYKYSEAKKYFSQYIMLQNILNKEPSVDDMVEYYDMDKNKAEELSILLIDTVSYNKKIDDSDKELLDSLEVTSTSFENDSVIKNDLEILFKKAKLSNKEIDILKKIYYDEMKGEEIGDYYGFTKKNVSKIKKTAIEKIKRTKMILSFACYMDNPKEAVQYVKGSRYSNSTSTKKKK